MPVIFQQILFLCTHIQSQYDIHSLKVGNREFHAGSAIERSQNAILCEHSIKVRINASDFLETPMILDSVLESIRIINVTLAANAAKSHGNSSFNNFSNATFANLGCH